MAEEVSNSNAQPLQLTAAQVSAIASDKELRSLNPSSEAYAAAFEKKFPSKNTKTESAPVASTEKETDKKVSETPTETSNDREGLSTRAQKRIDKLTAEREAEKANSAKLAARLAELEKAQQPTQKKETVKAPETASSDFKTPKPKLDDFNSNAEFIEALSDWKLDKREFERDVATKTKTVQESREKTLKTFFDSGKEFEKEMSLDAGDFELTVNDPDSTKTYPDTKAAILESPFNVQIAYELATLSDAEKARVEKMSVQQQLTYVGKLEAKFESKKQAAEETKTISSARAPGKALQKGKLGTAVQKITAGMSFKDFEAVRKEQHPDKYRK